MPPLSLLCAGSNARGQLATGDIEDAYHLSPCIFLGNAAGMLPSHVAAVEQIVCGSNHTLALLRTYDGKTELWGSGDGSKGQLGPSYAVSKKQANDSTVFRQLEFPSEVPGIGSLCGFMVRMIAAGWETSYVVLSRPERSDALLSMGANDFGNLGGGVSSSSRSSQHIHAVDLLGVLPPDEERSGASLKILSLSAGPHHTVVHISCSHPDGPSRSLSIVGWGKSRHGQLGNILDPAGRPVPFIPSPQLILTDSPCDITTIALGSQHTVCLRSSGHVSAHGSNRKDQLSGVRSLSEVEQVACTWNGTYALLQCGEVVATGSNTHSQLGCGPGMVERHGTLVSVRFPFALVPGQVSRLACGSEHVLCIVSRSTADGTGREVWGWGWNEHGNLGLGVTDDADVPVKLWPPPDIAAVDHYRGDVIAVWAGCGTSFILIRGR